MAEIDDRQKKARGGPDAQSDPIRNPDGIYSGASKRVAITDGTFAPIAGMPKDSRKRGKLDAD